MELNLTDYQKIKLKRAKEPTNIFLTYEQLKTSNIGFFLFKEALKIEQLKEIDKQLKRKKGVRLRLYPVQIRNLLLFPLSKKDIISFGKEYIHDFRGVYDINKLPAKIKKNECAVVWITFHWVCYYVKDDVCIYFNSLVDPMPEIIKNYLVGRDIESNRVVLQRDSDPPICGHLCMVVLYLLSEGEKYNEILRRLSNSKFKMIKEYFLSNFIS